VCVTLFQGIPKGDKMDSIVQKCVELGVFEIQPVVFSRCITQETRTARWQRIAIEAAKQCGRARIPQIKESIPFDVLLDLLPCVEQTYVCWEYAEAGGFKTMPRTAGLVIGPEGGITAEEFFSLTNAGTQPLSLGPRILRTETAGPTALAIALFAWGELGCRP